MKDIIERGKFNANKEIGYLEFKKFKPKPELIADVTAYNKELEGFITFLDEKFKEWENIRKEKV